MTRRAALVLAVAAGLGGCAAVIDLGSEATLRPPPEAGARETAAPEASAPADAGDASDGGPPLLCGLERSASEACATCIEQQCCEVSRTCADDPACAAGLECIKDCLAQLNCITGCLDNQNLFFVTDCSSRRCPACVPQQQCETLGACASTFDPGTQQGKLVRQLARTEILALDESACTTRRNNFRTLTDAGICR